MIDDFYNEKRHSKEHNGFISTQNQDKKFFNFFSLINIRMGGTTINSNDKNVRKSNFYMS